MGQKPPLFSIVIPTYGRPRQLADCLQSLARLDDSHGGFEVIVVDDGSETPPQAALATVDMRLDVRLLQQSHAGPAAARNTGALKARGAFLAFTDDDCQPAPDWLHTLARRMTADPECMIGGRTINALPGNTYSTASQLLIDYLYSYYNLDPGRARFFTSNNLAVAAERFRSVGGFDTGFPRAAAEDRELCDRWLSHGYRLLYAPEAVVHHAHALTFWKFLRQHYAYGRGAYFFHQIRSRRGAGHVKVEPLAFYRNLLRYPLSHVGGARAVGLSWLLACAQVANVAGFAWEKSRKLLHA
jgi:glycosyltransferase involved in cell wall biosynthesis